MSEFIGEVWHFWNRSADIPFLTGRSTVSNGPVIARASRMVNLKRKSAMGFSDADRPIQHPIAVRPETLAFKSALPWPQG